MTVVDFIVATGIYRETIDHNITTAKQPQPKLTTYKYIQVFKYFVLKTKGVIDDVILYFSFDFNNRRCDI